MGKRSINMQGYQTKEHKHKAKASILAWYLAKKQRFCVIFYKNVPTSSNCGFYLFINCIS